MGHDGKKKAEPAGESVGLWYISFADMITLLLSFFVMMTTFSSFDDEARRTFAGVCHSISANSVFPAHEIPREAFAQIVTPVIDYTSTGCEKPNELSDVNIKNPVHPEIPQEDRAFFEQKVIAIPASTLWGSDGQLSGQGRQLLGSMAKFIRKNPSTVLIAYPPNGESGQSLISASYRVDRAYTILQYLNKTESIPASQLSVYQPHAASPNPHEGKPILEITLRNGGIFK